MISVLYFSFDKVKEKGVPAQWFNLYGSSEPRSEKKREGVHITEEMARGNIAADGWVGRIFLEISARQVQAGKKNVFALPSCPSEPLKANYVLRYHLLTAADIPEDSLGVRLNIGTYEFKVTEFFVLS